MSDYQSKFGRINDWLIVPLCHEQKNSGPLKNIRCEVRQLNIVVSFRSGPGHVRFDTRTFTVAKRGIKRSPSFHDYRQRVFLDFIK